MNKKCQWCGEIYTPKKYANNSKYCSKTCANKKAYNTTIKAWAIKDRIKKQNAMYNESNAIKCEICGRYFRQVGSHVVQAHGYKSAREYREEYGFDVKRGQLPDEYKKIKHDHVFKNKTIDNLKAGEPYRFKAGQKGVGKYKRSAQTLERLSKFNKRVDNGESK